MMIIISYTPRTKSKADQGKSIFLFDYSQAILIILRQNNKVPLIHGGLPLESSDSRAGRNYRFDWLMYQSIPRLTTPLQANPRGNFLRGRIPPSTGHKESANPRPLGQKNRAKPPREIIFKNPAKTTTKHETETMKN